MMIDDEFRVWGKTDGRGLVVRSEEPVDFHPINKTANVVRVDSLDDAVKWVNVATQTIGFYPFARMPDYRDRLASGGAQRIVQLADARSEERRVGNEWFSTCRYRWWPVHEQKKN